MDSGLNNLIRNASEKNVIQIIKEILNRSESLSLEEPKDGRKGSPDLWQGYNQKGAKKIICEIKLNFSFEELLNQTSRFYDRFKPNQVYFIILDQLLQNDRKSFLERAHEKIGKITIYDIDDLNSMVMQYEDLSSKINKLAYDVAASPFEETNELKSQKSAESSEPDTSKSDESIDLKHALSTNANDNILVDKGYENQGIIGYIHSKNVAKTIPLHQAFLNDKRDYFYYIDRKLENLSDHPTSEEKIIGYLSLESGRLDLELQRFFRKSPYDHFYCTGPNDNLLSKFQYIKEKKQGFAGKYLLPQSGDDINPLYVYTSNLEIQLFTPYIFQINTEEIQTVINEKLKSGSKFWWLNIQFDYWEQYVAGTDNELHVEDAFNSEVLSIEEGDIIIGSYPEKKHITGIFEFFGYKETNEFRTYKGLYEFEKRISYNELYKLPYFGEVLDKFKSGDLHELGNNYFQEIINTTELKFDDTQNLPASLITSAYNDLATQSKDLLDVTREIEVFARLLAQKDLKPPLAIALFGNWGSGKSFFMHNLEVSIKQLSDSNTLKPDGTPFYCKEIVHISFNAWSYLDANLWVGFMASIFEKLDEYLTGITKDEKEKLQLEEKFVNTLEIVQNQKTKALLKKQNLEKEKEKLESRVQGEEKILGEQIEEIKKDKWSEITNTVWEQIADDGEVKKTLNELGVTPDVLEKSPVQYVKNKINSLSNYLKQFLALNFPQIIGILLILAALVLIPIFASQFLKSIGGKITSLITLFLGIWIKIRAAWLYLKPFIDKALNIQTQYVQELKEAERTHLENLAQLQLEKASKSQEIQNINSEIEELEVEITDVEYSLSHSLTRMALNNFISERRMSADYQDQLGIVSIIRRDLETLSGLFINQEIDKRLPQKEQDLLSEKNKEFQKIRDEFGERPLERIILYIDDLDRCADDKVLEVLQAVHLLMAFPLFIVVVGVDKRCVINALYNREVSKYFQLDNYQEEKNNKKSEGIHIVHPDEYLEKIFQIPFQLQKPAPQNIEHMIHELLEKDIHDENETDSNVDELSTENVNEPIPGESKDSVLKEQKTSQQQKDQPNNEIDEGKEEVQEPAQSTEPEKKPDIPPEGLRITETERNYIKKISPLIGSTPRTIKRFINIYRLIKAHQVLQSINADKEYLIVIFVLTMHLGKYKEKADDLFVKMRENQNSGLKEILNSMEGEEYKDIRLSLGFGDLQGLFDVEVGDFVDYLSFIRRFSFNALDEPIPLIQTREGKDSDV